MSPDETITLTRLNADANVSLLHIPNRIGSVQLISEIGRGGMGVIWRGHDHLLARDVAVKFLLGAVADATDPSFARFLEGARAAGGIKHRGLTAVYHADLVEGVPYLVMEYVSGTTLAEILRRTGPMKLQPAAAVLDAVCSAVGALHDGGIVHRDIKPANVLVELDGSVFVTDFGLACSRRQLGKPTARLPGSLVAGTPAYMAPEMFDGEVSARSDVYALGIMAFQILAGSLPFVGEPAELLTVIFTNRFR